jgi:RNA polymerase sigma-70 factor, ECF subfamily
MDSSASERVDQFMRLLVRHQGRLYQYVRMLMPRGRDVEDVLQQTFLVMWQKFDSSCSELSFYTWATRVAYLEVLKARGRGHRDLPLLDREILEKIVAEESEEPEFLASLKSLLEACLDRLAPDDRELIERRYQPGVLVQVLAENLGRPVNSVSKSLGRIRRTLWKCINEASSDHAGGREKTP